MLKTAQTGPYKRISHKTSKEENISCLDFVVDLIPKYGNHSKLKNNKITIDNVIFSLSQLIEPQLQNAFNSYKRTDRDSS